MGGLRFPVRGLLDGRRFETFHVDVGWGDPVVEPAETLTTPPLLAFAAIPPTAVPCYPLTQQVAEKVHAYTQPRATGRGQTNDGRPIGLYLHQLEFGLTILGLRC
jgi:arylamine N-acetyltransferase